MTKYDELLSGLQLFAEGDDGGADDSNDGGTTEVNRNSGEDSESLSFDDVLKDKTYQAEFDRRVQKAIATAVKNEKATWQALTDDKLTEAERLAKMTAEERAAYKTKQLEKEVADLKRQAAMTEMESTARGMMVDKGITLPDALLSHLVSEDAEATKASVEAFATLFNATVQNAVKDALKGKTPPAGTGKPTLTKEEIFGIKNPAERQRLIAENMELFE